MTEAVTFFSATPQQHAWNSLLVWCIDPNDNEFVDVLRDNIMAACYGVPDSPEAADTIDFCRQVVVKVRCIDCQQRTLSVASPIDVDAAALRLCLVCYDRAGLENEHSDGYHKEGCPQGCPERESA